GRDRRKAPRSSRDGPAVMEQAILDERLAGAREAPDVPHHVDGLAARIGRAGGAVLVDVLLAGEVDVGDVIDVAAARDLEAQGLVAGPGVVVLDLVEPARGG